MPDSDPREYRELVERAARAAEPPAFDLLAGRARRRRLLASAAAGVAAALVVGGGFGVARWGGSGVEGSVAPAHHGAPSGHTPPSRHPTATLRTPPSLATTSEGPSPQSCPSARVPGLPHGAACLSRVYGDFDGDGQRDTLYVFGLSKRVGGPMLNLPNDWRARLVLGSGGVRNLRLSSSAVGPLGALAAVDANRDGRSDALILLNRGASDDFIGIVTLTHGRLGLLSGPDGRPFEFDYGGSVMQGGGGGCRIGRGLPEIFQSSYFFARRDHRWHWQVRRYRWQGATVVLYGRSTGTTAPPQTQRYTDFRCFGFSLPPGGSVNLRYWR